MQEGTEKPQSISEIFPGTAQFLVGVFLLISLIVVGSIYAEIVGDWSTDIPYLRVSILLLYLCTKLYVAAKWSLDTAFAIRWSAPEVGAFRSLNKIISTKWYLAFQSLIAGTIFLFWPQDIPYRLETSAQAIFLYRVFYALLGAILLPWLLLRFYLLLRFGWTKMLSFRWIAD